MDVLMYATLMFSIQIQIFGVYDFLESEMDAAS